MKFVMIPELLGVLWTALSLATSVEVGICDSHEATVSLCRLQRATPSALYSV